eukprot:1145327-Pelagomonas_calceolata.AAC.8
MQSMLRVRSRQLENFYTAGQCMPPKRNHSLTAHAACAQAAHVAPEIKAAGRSFHGLVKE